MYKKIIGFCVLSAFLGGVIGSSFGFLYAYFNPMSEIEGYWEVNQLIKTPVDQYHLNARVTILGREIATSADLYDDHANFKVNREMLFRVLDIKMNIFNGKVVTMVPERSNDEELNNLLTAPYVISYPMFFLLDCNTVIMEQSQGHPLGTARLLKRVNNISCKNP